MWCCYRLNFEQPPRGDEPRELARVASAFADAIVSHFASNASWTAASATAKDGSIDVWFGLPQLPAHPEVDPVWREHLRSFGLSGQRVPNRN